MAEDNPYVPGTVAYEMRATQLAAGYHPHPTPAETHLIGDSRISGVRPELRPSDQGQTLSMTVGQEIGPRSLHTLDTRFPDEPIVIFRAKNILSLMVLQHYVGLLEMYTPHSDLAETATETINQFRAWQQVNPDKVKIPD